MDISRTAEPRSDQMNFDDVMVRSLTVTVEAVKQGTPDQPVEIHLAEYPGRPFKPSKSMRRVLIAAWGVEAEAYIGRQMTLYGDPTVTFGKEAVGGIRISHLSHLANTLSVQLTVTRGKRKPFVVQPLATSDRDWLAELELAGDDLEAVTALGKAAGEAHAPSDAIEALRVKFRALTKTPAGTSVVTGAVPDDSSGTASLPVDPAHPDYVAKADER